MAWHNAFMKKIIMLASLFALATPTAANDSSAAIGLGGLALTRNEAISMDSEELFLSADRVTVKYRFTNNSATDVDTLVSFPLPPLPGGIEGYLGDQSFPDWQSDLQFKTLVDGKPVKLDIHEVVTLMGINNLRDVSGRLKALGWPTKHWIDYKFEESLQELPDAQREAFVKEGLLHKDESGPYVRPNWQVATHVTRTQNFPAGKTVTVEHSYKPVVGGSVGGMMEKPYRKEAYFNEYLASYCIDKAFLAGFDKRRYSKRKDAEGNEPDSFYVETWLDYVLKSGANWHGPIKDFRLVVDKGRADNMVSFCMDGVKKISPTQFEVRKINYEPDKDLNILIVEWAPID
jgi:Domain of unknown function (DUF4424)